MGCCRGYIAWGEEENRIALTPDKESKPLPIRAEPYQVLAFENCTTIRSAPIDVLEYMRWLVFWERSLSGSRQAVGASIAIDASPALTRTLSRYRVSSHQPVVPGPLQLTYH